MYTKHADMVRKLANIIFLLSGIALAINAETSWDVVVKTCDRSDAGTDARVYLKVFYEQGHVQQTFELGRSGHDDFERNQVDHYRLILTQTDIVNLGLYWWPSFTLSEGWCVDWLVLMNAELDKCLIADFNGWILHYRDPPTYPARMGRATFANCVQPMRITEAIAIVPHPPNRGGP